MSSFHFLRFALLTGIIAIIPGRAEEPLPQLERLQSSPVLRHLKRNDLGHAPRTPGEETLAKMYLPEGFRAEVVVEEPDLQQPVAFAFDERGRIWVAEAYSYPQKQPEGKGLDKIVIFEDSDGDGKFETRKVFAEGLNLVSGFEVGFGGVWIGAAPQLLFIPDRNHDDQPDGPPEVLLDGFGYQDTHECLNSFMWGPDGWLYGNQGVFNYAKIGQPGAPDDKRTELRAGVWRYHPIRHQFEIFAEGGSNQWGLDYDEFGQIFMTHCRSYWGRGGITHVIQGGHFWNQANANYAPFIIAEPPKDFPEFRNYLLASARHDHGAGGAGERGTDAIYGGHSHVGTMIYYGDNWPDEYRGHLFTHNLGGHQINQEINKPLGSSFETVHADTDISFCADPNYVAVDLQYGPDGAVYIIDWSDQQHCHNPNSEKWDRSNGRIYRLEYAATYKPRKVDLAALDDHELASHLNDKNQWFVRTAERLLQERRHFDNVDGLVLDQLRKNLVTPTQNKWQSLVLLARLGALPDVYLDAALRDKDEYTRAWAIQIAAEGAADYRAAHGLLFASLAKGDPSPVVRRYLASAAQRLPDETAWPIIEALAMHGEDRDDRNIPFLLWQSLAQRMPKHMEAAFALAQRTPIRQIADWIYWYAATLGDDGIARVVQRTHEADPKDQSRFLAALELALKTRADVPVPKEWPPLAEVLYQSENKAVIQRAEIIASAFGDQSRFPQLRAVLADFRAAAPDRDHAFVVLSRAHDRASLPTFIGLLDDKRFRPKTIPLLARFDTAEIAPALLNNFQALNADEKNAALNALSSRASFGSALLDAVQQGVVKRDQLTAFHVRQLLQLHNPDIDQRVAKTWGRITTSPGEKQEQIARLEKVFNEAPLWAYDGGAGREHFVKLCAQCHRVGNDGARLGPELTGAGKNGIRYYLENIIDPNAVIGADFQMTTIETKSGETISGLLANESQETITIHTVTGEEKVAKMAIAQRVNSEKSLMPEGLLETLNAREKIELLKFLTTH
ncbi:MAG TPA: PVC-type heme-binding CxxCH protein [Verrucomicrobiae bacterium]|nr:PVC-type heme-binding CxxCH protein [Verrucomicrobiae bacterium]